MHCVNSKQQFYLKRADWINSISSFGSHLVISKFSNLDKGLLESSSGRMPTLFKRVQYGTNPGLIQPSLLHNNGILLALFLVARLPAALVSGTAVAKGGKMTLPCCGSELYLGITGLPFTFVWPLFLGLFLIHQTFLRKFGSVSLIIVIFRSQDLIF